MLLLLPCDPFDPRKPDDHFHDEWVAAHALGIPVALVDHDALARPGGAVAGVAGMRRDARAPDVVYRGWMLRSEEYAAFEDALKPLGVTLRTNALQYRHAHELPGWYDELTGVTPESVWTTGSSPEAFRERCRQLGAGPAVLRDYSKSMKHYWHEAAFVPDVADADGAWKIAQRFLELRGDSFVGGLVLRRFESLQGEEARTWWVNGTCVLVTAHPDSESLEAPPNVDLAAVTPLMSRLDLPFVTVDLSLRTDGSWRVIELGDGQVSDRPRATPPEGFLAAVIGNHTPQR